VVGLSDQDIARLQEQIKTLFGDLAEVKTDVKELKDQLANRLPAWATMAISVLTGLCGFLAARAF
jgi:hypoxanthine-guanine phosphoribosyltransferase